MSEKLNELLEKHQASSPVQTRCDACNGTGVVLSDVEPGFIKVSSTLWNSSNIQNLFLRHGWDIERLVSQDANEDWFWCEVSKARYREVDFSKLDLKGKNEKV